jgi:hypothetical protein
MAHKSHDCFCAVCGGILEDYLNIGENTEKSKATRAMIIEIGRAKRAVDRDNSALEAWRLTHKLEDPGWRIEGSYDPEVLQGHDHSWLNELVCVAYDSDLNTPCQYYFSTEGNIAVFTWEVEYARHPDGLDDDKNLPLYNRTYFFDKENPTRKLGFPMHTHCAQVLAKAITGSSDIRLLNPTVLYQLMDEHDLSYKLQLDYGPIQDAQIKYWASSAGEEVKRIAAPSVRVDVDLGIVYCREPAVAFRLACGQKHRSRPCAQTWSRWRAAQGERTFVHSHRSFRQASPRAD